MNIMSAITYGVVYHLVGYRRKVVAQNLERCFPEKSEEERKELAKKYYHHMSDLLVEEVLNIFTSPEGIYERYKFVNREVLDQYYDEGKSVVLMSAHYNNWEYMILSLNLQVLQHGVATCKPLHNKRIGKFIDKRRARYGTEIASSENIRDIMAYYNKYKIPIAYLMLCDQAPHNPRKCYWTNFLHQDTGWIYGPEHFARKYNFPVVYFVIKKVKRGHYEIHFETLCDDPSKVPEYSITEQYVRKLEKEIINKPEYWLWSHKRWKKKRPKDM